MLRIFFTLLLLICLPTVIQAQIKTEIKHNGTEIGTVKEGLDSLGYTRKEQELLDSAQASPKIAENLKRQSSKIDSSIAAVKKIKNFGFDTNSLAIDTLMAFRKVYSERQIREWYDSLNVIKKAVPIKELLTEEELTNLINRKFSEIPSGEGEDSVQSMMSVFADKSLLAPDVEKLNILGERQLPVEYIKKIDSIRSINLKEQHMKLEERQLSSLYKLVELKEQPTFWKRSYFEGIIGISDIENSLVQLTPAIGFHFLENLSFGMGPVIQIYKQRTASWQTSAGFRQFIKQEVLNRRAYMQLEYIMNPQKVSAEKVVLNRHSFMAGMGTLLPVSRSVSMNIAVLYQVNKNQSEFANATPWVVRIGISSISKSGK